jgi:glycosyltransferase involved in cell wall biosynthesis
MSKPFVALFRNSFLPYSETFIYECLLHYKLFRPIVFAKKRLNQKQFPFEPAYIVGGFGKFERFLFSSGIESPSVTRAFIKHQPKIIHAHFGQSGILAIPYAKKFSIPLIVSLHGNDVGILLGRQRFKPKWWFYTLSFKKLVRHANLFLAASNDLRDCLIKLGCPADKIKTHHLGIDLEKFRMSDREKTGEAINIFMIGRLVEKKGFAYGIEAFAAALRQLNSPKLKLIVIGDGPLEARLKKLVKECGVASHVHFWGRRSHQQISDYLQKQATILMCPSVVTRAQDRDSGLMVAKEAAACGVPIIGTYHGGLPDIIENKKTGFLAAERDITALAQAIKELATNADLRVKFGRAAQQKVKQNFNIKNQMAELEAIYFEEIEKLNKIS